MAARPPMPSYKPPPLPSDTDTSAVVNSRSPCPSDIQIAPEVKYFAKSKFVLQVFYRY